MEKKTGQPTLPGICMSLLFHDLQDLHGAGLDADAAGDALGSGILGLQDHDLHGAGLHTLAAGNALFLVDHVNAGLGVLGDGLVLTGAHALAALDADVGLGSIALGNDADAAEILIKLLIECFGAGLNALQAGHTFGIFLNNELLHKKDTPLSICYYHFIIQPSSGKCNYILEIPKLFEVSYL